jgi:hypothetical protein
MGLVDDLIEETVDSSTDVNQILRRAKILAHELGSKELSEWADAELNGYAGEDNLPDYRISPGTNVGNLAGSFGASITNSPLHLLNLPENIRNQAEKLRLNLGIAELQEMYSSSEEYTEAWNQDVVALFGDKFFTGYKLMQAWKVIPKARIAYVLDSVRNRLLNFLLSLKDAHPEVESAGANLKSISQEETRINVVNNIWGGTNFVASGEHIQQSASQGVTPGDIESLLQTLKDAGVSVDLSTELIEAINDESDASPAGGIGPKVAGWLSTVSGKVTAAASTVATQAVLKYYGL